MRPIRTSRPLLTSASLLVALTACGPEAEDNSGASVQSGAFQGTYEVPVAAELAAAAIYDVAKVEWTVAGGSATLEYDLPLGLVGKEIRLEFTGPVDLASGTATLVGPPGDAACVIEGAAITCTEHMAGLLPLTPDLAVVEQLAAAEFAGPASMRLDVAKQFSADPIGIVRFDASAAADDD